MAESKIWHVENSDSVLVPWPVADLSSRSVAAMRVLASRWTSYYHRLNYQTFDVTAQIWTGENVLAVEVAEQGGYI